jgi:signal transduction histidine kinase
VKSTSGNVLFWAGIATCVLSALPVWVDLVRRPALLTAPRFLTWAILFGAFLAAFAARTLPAAEARWRSAQWALLIIQSLAGLAMNGLRVGSLEAVLLVVVAAQLRGVMSLRPALVWVVVQSVALGVLLAEPGRDLTMMITVACAFAGFQLFALYTFHMADNERQAREALVQANQELVATRQLLAESSRAAERLRISRELHDALGHHLTALTLNLEAALHAPDDERRQHVETAQRLARDLLGEVRQVVGELRREEEVGALDGTLAGHLAAALSAPGGEAPLVHLLVQPDVRIGDPGLEHAIVRCAQEIFTNAVRHSGARNLWLEVARADAGLVLRAHDDGRGAARIEPGNGLRGMRERVEERGGRLDLSALPGDGFHVTAWLPSAGGAA